MKIRNLLLLVLLFSLFHFSPLVATATVGENSEDAEREEVESEVEETESADEAEEEPSDTEEVTEEQIDTEDASKEEKTEQSAESDETTENEVLKEEEATEEPSESGEGEEATEEPSESGEEEEATKEPSESEEVEEPEKVEEQSDTEEDTVDEATKKLIESGEYKDDLQPETQKMGLMSINAVYQYGDNGEHVVELKKNLTKLGFGKFPPEPTIYYGDVTEGVVKDFQRYYGLTVDGIAGPNTLTLIEEILASPFQVGGYDERNITLKEDLETVGYSVSNNPTTYYGTSTEATVREFQADNNLVVNGIADPITRNKLEELVIQHTDPTLHNGVYSDEVIDLKVNLDKLGFHVSNNPTTYFGPSTAQKVKEFQEYYGVSGDEAGVAGEATLSYIDELLASPFQSGYYHEQTIKLKEDLAKLGYVVSSNPTTYYGDSTTQSVREFQNENGLVVNGIADPVTWNKLESLAYGDLYNGVYRDDVIDLKVKLDRLGFHVSSNPTTYFGPSTEKVVIDFQNYYGVSGDTAGVAGEATLGKIEELLASPFQSGKRHERTITLKEDLAKVGIQVSNNPTTYYGSSTEQAVKDFQAAHDLVVNGIADPVTWSKLEELANGPMYNGLYREDVIDLKINLEKLGFHVSNNPTNYFGPSTEKVVKDFQAYYGVEEDSSGVAGDATLKQIDQILSSPFRVGESSSETIILKENLNRLGFGNIQVTEHYGELTEEKVKDFQKYYGLVVNGIADEPTQSKIEDILASPLQVGSYHEDAVELKEDLAKLGYKVSNNPTNYFGPSTEDQVRAFQRDNSLPVSGIAEETTLEAIATALEDREIITHTTFDVTMEEALEVQMNQLQQTDKYRNDPAYIHADYVDVTEFDAISGSRVNVRTAPELDSSTIAYMLTQGTIVEIKREVEGDAVDGDTTWYELTYKGETLYAHTSLVDEDLTIAKTTAALNVRAAKSSSSHIYGVLKDGETVNIVNTDENWYEITYGTWRNPTSSEVEFYLNPNNNDMFQHLELSTSVSVDASQLNNVLDGKGILSGQGLAFIEAGDRHRINEIYLISHALLETGHGTSALATGIEVGIDENDNAVLVTTSNRDSLSGIETVYNMFGVGAIDGDAHRAGAVRAYEEEWFTPGDAIIGGAKFIGSRYVHNDFKQDTLYKMRWNPANPGYPQYATDIAWATKQVAKIKDMYSLLNNPLLKFNIVEYK
ncbi:peptidoglycan-binding protein [Thalassobacillus sp. B23F22_16]|uniref:peptidoglycan-binding protein n=1 Tax=Thalassobacillus sp. B23F22_16 TaxID=3459513 RepID=UPI00373E9516